MATELLSFKASDGVQARVAEMAKARGLNRSAAIKAAILEATEKAGGGDKAEVLELLWESARGGNVTAMKTVWQILDALERQQPEAGDVLDELDELAQRRGA